MPAAAVKDILTQGDSEGKRGKWISKIQEYDLDIRPTKLIKGQGLAKMLSESNYQALGINFSIIAGEESEEKEEQHGIGVASPETHIK